MSPAVKDSRWNLRVAPADDLAVRQAAELVQSKPAEFIRSAAIKEAEQILTDRTHFELASEQWDEFVEILDRPPRVPEGLKELFSKPSVFE